LVPPGQQAYSAVTQPSPRRCRQSAGTSSVTLARTAPGCGRIPPRPISAWSLAASRGRDSRPQFGDGIVRRVVTDAQPIGRPGGGAAGPSQRPEGARQRPVVGPRTPGPASGHRNYTAPGGEHSWPKPAGPVLQPPAAQSGAGPDGVLDRGGRNARKEQAASRPRTAASEPGLPRVGQSRPAASPRAPRKPRTSPQGDSGGPASEADRPDSERCRPRGSGSEAGRPFGISAPGPRSGRQPFGAARWPVHREGRPGEPSARVLPRTTSRPQVEAVVGCRWSGRSVDAEKPAYRCQHARRAVAQSMDQPDHSAKQVAGRRTSGRESPGTPTTSRAWQAIIQAGAAGIGPMAYRSA